MEGWLSSMLTCTLENKSQKRKWLLVDVSLFHKSVNCVCNVFFHLATTEISTLAAAALSYVMYSYKAGLTRWERILSYGYLIIRNTCHRQASPFQLRFGTGGADLRFFMKSPLLSPSPEDPRGAQALASGESFLLEELRKNEVHGINRYVESSWAKLLKIETLKSLLFWVSFLLWVQQERMLKISLNIASRLLSSGSLITYVLSTDS